MGNLIWYGNMVVIAFGMGLHMPLGGIEFGAIISFTSGTRLLQGELTGLEVAHPKFLNYIVTFVQIMLFL
jgi:hypothetical protein